MRNPFKKEQSNRTEPSNEERANRIQELQEQLLDEELTDDQKRTIAAEMAFEGSKILDNVKNRMLRTAKIAAIIALVVVALAVAAIYLSTGDEAETEEDGESDSDETTE